MQRCAGGCVVLCWAVLSVRARDGWVVVVVLCCDVLRGGWVCGSWCESWVNELACLLRIEND